MAGSTTTQQNEVMVSAATPTQLDPTALASRNYIEVTNNGDMPIWLVTTTGAAPGSITPKKAIPVQPGETWVRPLGTAVHVYALAEGVTQVTGNATMVTEYGG